MGDTLKKLVASRVIALVRQRENDQTMDRTRCETALRRLGMKAGNAQRLLDETSDVQLARLAEAAAILGVQAADLLPASTAKAAAAATATLPTDLPDALPVVLDAITSLPPTRWASVRAQLDMLAAHPEMRDDVLAELQHLLVPPPSKPQRAA